MTDIVVSEGYAAAGYEYINVDDCWLEKERNYNGQLQADRIRFPYGMKSLSDYVSIMQHLTNTYFFCTYCLRNTIVSIIKLFAKFNSHT